MRISDWSSDVCSSDLRCHPERSEGSAGEVRKQIPRFARDDRHLSGYRHVPVVTGMRSGRQACVRDGRRAQPFRRSEEHTYELQSLMRISYAVFGLNKKKEKNGLEQV